MPLKRPSLQAEMAAWAAKGSWAQKSGKLFFMNISFLFFLIFFKKISFLKIKKVIINFLHNKSLGNLLTVLEK